MTDGWRDDERRQTARDAIAHARRRLACELQRSDPDGTGWHTKCPRCSTTSSGTFAEVELWATRHLCNGRNPMKPSRVERGA